MMLHRFVPLCLLALILSAASLPHATHDEDGTSPGKLKRGAPASSGNDATNPSVFGYGCSCYRTGPPEEDIMWLKSLAVDEPHPMLTLSELAESIHRSLVCKRCPDSINQQGEDDTVKEVTRRMHIYLNITRQQNSVDPCLPVYNINFYPKRYPRYLVEVTCPQPTEEQASSSCSRCSGGSGIICFSYLDKISFLSNDPKDPLCPHATSQSWKRCPDKMVGVGCSCLAE